MHHWQCGSENAHDERPTGAPPPKGEPVSVATTAMEDDLEIKPLGSGCEVGRSCVLMTFKGYKILFDCGVHPAHTGLASLPYFDDIDPSEIDLLLVTHFHMDHCGAVPYFTEKTGFRGRVFMTHATKAIYKILMHDASRLDRGEDKLFDEKDMLKSMEKIEPEITCGREIIQVSPSGSDHTYVDRFYF